MLSRRAARTRESDVDSDEGRRASKRRKRSPASASLADNQLATLVASLLEDIEQIPPDLAVEGFARVLKRLPNETDLVQPSFIQVALQAIDLQINTLMDSEQFEANPTLRVMVVIKGLNYLNDMLLVAHVAAREQAAMPVPSSFASVSDWSKAQDTSLAKHQEDIANQLVAKWSRPISGLSLTELRTYLQQPLAEDEKIPIPLDVFTLLSRNNSYVEFPRSAVSAEQLETLFRVSTDERAWVVEISFINAVEADPPASGTEDLFHSTWDNNISRILKLILSNATPIRSGNDNTTTALKQPDYGFLINNHCIFRGEEKGSDGAGDPAQELVDKLIWSYDPLPYVLGYHARATDVHFVAISQPPVTTIPLFDHDLNFKKERVANLVHLIRLSGVVAGLGQQLHRRHRPEFVEFDRKDGLVKMSISAVVRKEFRHPGAVAHVSKLIEIYGLLNSKQVPNVDTLDRADTHGDYPHVQLSPVGYEALPKSGSEALKAVVCVLEALKVMHSSPNPVYHRDIREPNIIKRFDGQGWFLIDWSDASTVPTRAAMHLKKSEHSPMVRQDGHGQEVDIWGIGRYMEGLASRVTCQIAKPEAVKQMARRWMTDLTTSAAAALDEINANQELFTEPGSSD